MRAPFAFSRSRRARRSRQSRRPEAPKGNVTASPVSREIRLSPSTSRSHASRSGPAAPGRMVVKTASGEPARGAHEGDDLLLGRERPRHLASVDRLVQLEPVHRHPHRARGDAFGHQLGHPCDVVVGGGLVGRAALAHHEGAHRAVGDLRGDVDRAGHAVDRVEILGHGLPVPRDRLAQRSAGDAFDALHEADQPIVPVGRGGREPDTAVAHHHRRDAVPDRGREQRVPGDLPVVVGVDVDEAGRDREAGGVELLTARVADGAHGGDAPVVDRHVGGEGPTAPAVDHGPVADDHLVHAGPPLRSGGPYPWSGVPGTPRDPSPHVFLGTNGVTEAGSSSSPRARRLAP